MRPVEDFFRQSQQSGYQISPDGRYITYLAPYEECLNIYITRAENLADSVLTSDTSEVDDTPCPEEPHPLRLTSDTHRGIDGYMWADNERILYVRDTDGDENYRLYGVKPDGSDLRCYTPFEGVRCGIIDELRECPDEVMICMNRRNPECFDPYRLNLRTGELTLLAENPGNWQGWLTDHHGKLRAVTAIVDGVDTEILYRETEDADFEPVIRVGFHDTLSFVMFTADNNYVYAASNIGRDRTALVIFDPKTGKEVEVLYEDEKYDVASMVYSRKRGKLLSAYCSGHRYPVRHFFDEDEKRLREHLQSLFPGYRVGMVDSDLDEQSMILFVGNDKTRGSYYYYKQGSTERPLHIADAAPWLDEKEMADMQAVNYKTRDGLDIEAYLSLPKGAKDTPLPVIINVHGGPWARDHWGFNSEVQFLCSRGYAVFQMNFRGSTGYGRNFLEASYKQWGLKMQDDITDGVQWLIAQGIADPRRIAIYGGSYGGYATLAGLCFTPDLYCCGIDYVGVSNLLTFMNTIPPYWRPMLEMIHLQIGDPDADREQLVATSPALNAEKIKAPLFIAQGANDPRVNKAESDQMVEALRSRGVEVEYMVKADEGHGFARQQNRFDFYNAMERFLAQHL